MTKIEFHPEARLDLESARSWYRERSKLAARAFITEVLRALRSIAASPDAWPRTRANERRFVLKRFPYSIISALAKMKFSLPQLLTTGDCLNTGMNGIDVRLAI